MSSPNAEMWRRCCWERSIQLSPSCWVLLQLFYFLFFISRKCSRFCFFYTLSSSHIIMRSFSDDVLKSAVWICQCVLTWLAKNIIIYSTIYWKLPGGTLSPWNGFDYTKILLILAWLKKRMWKLERIWISIENTYQIFFLVYFFASATLIW